MPVILAFDTSATHCAAALLSGDRVIAARSEAMDKGQAERLMPMLQEVLADAGLAWSGVGAVAVGTGPGNFTGVRIAVAAARGLALGLGIPAVGVTRFDALALGLPGVTVALQARRDEMYLAAAGTEPVITPRGVSGNFGPFVGDAGLMPEVRPRFPLAEAIARVAAARLDRPQPRPAPFYLRPADAALPADPPPVILP